MSIYAFFSLYIKYLFIKFLECEFERVTINLLALMTRNFDFYIRIYIHVLFSFLFFLCDWKENIFLNTWYSVLILMA